jgi:hypothetical protein
MPHWVQLVLVAWGAGFIGFVAGMLWVGAKR